MESEVTLSSRFKPNVFSWPSNNRRPRLFLNRLQPHKEELSCSGTEDKVLDISVHRHLHETEHCKLTVWFGFFLKQNSFLALNSGWGRDQLRQDSTAVPVSVLWVSTSHTWGNRINANMSWRDGVTGRERRGRKERKGKEWGCEEDRKGERRGREETKWGEQREGDIKKTGERWKNEMSLRRGEGRKDGEQGKKVRNIFCLLLHFKLWGAAGRNPKEMNMGFFPPYLCLCLPLTLSVSPAPLFLHKQ